MNTPDKHPEYTAKDALRILEEAWTYFFPEPLRKVDDPAPELFQYHMPG